MDFKNSIEVKILFSKKISKFKDHFEKMYLVSESRMFFRNNFPEKTTILRLNPISSKLAVCPVSSTLSIQQNLIT